VTRFPGALLLRNAGPLPMQFEIDDRSAEQVRLIGLPLRSVLGNLLGIGQRLKHRQCTQGSLKSSAGIRHLGGINQR
jgi:hypothetical protein